MRTARAIQRRTKIPNERRQKHEIIERLMKQRQPQIRGFFYVTILFSTFPKRVRNSGFPSLDVALTLRMNEDQRRC